jgi:hypothetical protein
MDDISSLPPPPPQVSCQELYKLIEGATLIELPRDFRHNQVTETPAVDDNEWRSKFLEACFGDGSDNLDDTPSNIIDDPKWSDNFLIQYFSDANNSFDVVPCAVEHSIEVSSVQPDQGMSEGDFGRLSPNSSKF